MLRAPKALPEREHSGEDTDVDVVEVGASEALPSSRRRHSDEIARRYPSRCSLLPLLQGAAAVTEGEYKMFQQAMSEQGLTSSTAAVTPSKASDKVD